MQNGWIKQALAHNQILIESTAHQSPVEVQEAKTIILEEVPPSESQDESMQKAIQQTGYMKNEQTKRKHGVRFAFANPAINWLHK